MESITAFPHRLLLSAHSQPLLKPSPHYCILFKLTCFSPVLPTESSHAITIFIRMTAKAPKLSIITQSLVLCQLIFHRVARRPKSDYVFSWLKQFSVVSQSKDKSPEHDPEPGPCFNPCSSTILHIPMCFLYAEQPSYNHSYVPCPLLPKGLSTYCSLCLESFILFYFLHLVNSINVSHLYVVDITLTKSSINSWLDPSNMHTHGTTCLYFRALSQLKVFIYLVDYFLNVNPSK